MTMLLTRRSAMLGTAAAVLTPLRAAAKPASSQVRALASEWLDEQYAYCCAFRSVFHPGGTAERIVPPDRELRLWLEARRSLEHKTDRLIFSPPMGRDDVVLKSAALGCFFAEERLPDCRWAVVHAERWIGVLESEILAFGSADIRTWRPEYEIDLASAFRAHGEI